MLTTKRLILRPWQKTDLAAMHAVCSNPEVMRFFPAPYTKEQTKAFIGRQHIQQQQRGHCFFAAELRETQKVIGFIGLSYLDLEVDFAPCVEIGWRLHPDTWGQGLAPEGARACLDFGFHELGLNEIYANTPAINLPSRSVMTKIGMTEFCSFKHPKLEDFPDLEECVSYRITSG
ncbi:GNAT family N-acetyltransferase [Neolewinella aurantiaca]|uniref:GNAT family N-acetyltransferase n=1 Tax=Neolewinella aurantiaca TaxID=2602767 RepID=A0A5C7F9Y3_9BACT|nr:GNAT family N-acetyltransferase [Neolewinella aurantiaca]TXF87581.1 GNAT family N-acetyltransferase [Neolewinella aurantiaca]